MATINTIPSIPLSPVAKAWLLCRTNLEQADTALSKAKSQTQPAVSVSVLRKLIEDVKVERHRYDNLGRQMQSVQTATAFQWSPDALAKQIAVIDCQLFGMVKLEKSYLCQTDLAQSHLDRLLDFHHYLTNSFAHQLIFWSSLTKTATTNVIPQVHPKDNMISHLVQVAHSLLHTYRDFSGFVAIMKALMLPQVRRLRSLWKNCPSRIKEMYNEMVPILSPDQHYQAYHNVLSQKLSYFFFTATTSATQSIGTTTSPSASTSSSSASSSMLPRMVVIPWMQPHLISLRSIVTDYAAMGGHNTTAATAPSPQASSSDLCHQEPPSLPSSTSSLDLVLSAPGLQKLAVVMALLEQCQTCSVSSSSSLPSDFVLSSSSSIDILEDYLRPWRQDHSSNGSDGKRSRRQSMISSNTKAATTVCDLHILFPGDLLVHHWLVSRVYLRMDQLVDESIQVQPLLDGEQLVCDTYSPDDASLISITSNKPITTLQHQQQQHISEPVDSPSDGPDHSHPPLPTVISTTSPSPDSTHGNRPSIDRGPIKEQQQQQEQQHLHVDKDASEDNSNATDLNKPTVLQTNAAEKRPTMDANQPETQATTSTPVDEDTTLPDTPVEATEPSPALDDCGKTNETKTEEDSATHTLTTASTLASAAASLSSSSSSTASTSSSVSVIIEEPAVIKVTLEEPDSSHDDQQQEQQQQHQQHQQQQRPTSLDSSSGKKSKLSPTAPEFVPTAHYENIPSSVAVTPSSSIHDDGSIAVPSKKRNGYIPPATTITATTTAKEDDTTSEDDDEWNGYPTPDPQQHQQRSRGELEEDEEDEVWTGYPMPKRRGSLQSVLSDEWKGYQAAKMEAAWELETALKVQQHDWQGYALETLNEEDPENA